MAATIRTFIGVHIAATSAIEAMLRELRGMGRSVRPTSPEQLHLTLKFLGETPKETLTSIRKELAEVALSAARHAIELVGLGAFPTSARPTVIWAGIEAEEPLKQMAAALDALLEPLGFVPEARPFHPHLTLARVNGSVAGLSEFLTEQSRTPFGEALVEKVTLYQSEPGRDGSRYTELASAALRQN